MATLTLEDQNRIDTAIQDLQLQLGFSYPEMNILDLAQTAGVQVFETDLTELGASGLLQYDNDELKTNPRIYLNISMSPERKVFTLAHELGHHFLHKGEKWRLDKLDYSLEDQNTKEESEANYFAASILVPKELLLYRKSEGDTVERLADYFNVSIPVVKNRLRWVGVNGG
ncbi:MAG TPA: ImmA/IrrE family metallo-endopeptidase [Candidatus Saccharimonas sp.]|nr:ImmA/IrrE family metallo-endopeptidase [Candidatus Saccharimonas sp.]